MLIPEALRRHRADPVGAAWLDDLPRLVAACVDRWGLRLGDPYPGATVSFVAPAARDDGTAVVLKIQLPHRECEHEAAALAVWDGAGAVRLLDHDPTLGALVLERCTPGTHLAGRDPEVALDVLVGLLPRLWHRAGTPFRDAADEARAWAIELPARWERAGRPFERALLDAAVGTLAELVASPGPRVLVHQDLHADNVLAAEREPWLVIDPKPLAGDRELGLAPIVRSYELGHSRAAVLHRLDRLSAELGVDRGRARAWALAQTVAWAFAGDTVLPRHVDTARWLRAAG